MKRAVEHLKIKAPIWKSRSVGIADFRCDNSDILLEVLYKNKKGERIYPDKYFIKEEVIKRYPTQTVRGGIKLYIIPLSHLKKFIFDGQQSLFELQS